MHLLGSEKSFSYEKVLKDAPDLTTFPASFERMPSSKRTRWVHALVFRAMSSEDRKRFLLSLSGRIATEVVEEVEEVRYVFVS